MFRKKIWQLDEKLHCSLVGSCLTLQDMKSIGKKANIAFEIPPSEYELHRALVAAAGDKSAGGHFLQKHLDKKYASSLAQFKIARSEEALEAAWKKALATGDIAGAYWALLTHPAVTRKLEDQAYGQMHMLSHLAATAHIKSRHKLATTADQLASIKRELDKARLKFNQQLSSRDESIARLKERAEALEKALAEQKDFNSRLSAAIHPRQVKKLQAQVNDYSTKLLRSHLAVDRMKKKNDRLAKASRYFEHKAEELEQENRQIASERQALETSLTAFLNTDTPAQTCQFGACHDRCILYVGGRSRQCRYFRSLVEKNGGQFIHHDGGKQESLQQLESALPRADAVICPLDCISHDAMKRVRKHCKSSKKRVVYLPRGSLSAFVQGLNDLAF